MSAHYCRCQSIEMAPLQDETILFDPEKKKFCVLNRTASFIWNQLAASITTEALAGRMCQGFAGVSLENALNDTNRTIQEMLTLTFVAGKPAQGESLATEPDAGNKPGQKTISSVGGPDSTGAVLPTYEPPRLTVMNEDEVLSAFQVPVVAGSWWG